MDKSQELKNEEANLTGSDLTKIVNNEIIILERENRRSKYLNLVYNNLLTIKPTSVESERAFSVAGIICTKIRSNLSDDTLDTICMLRAHFIKENKKKRTLNCI